MTSFSAQREFPRQQRFGTAAGPLLPPHLYLSKSTQATFTKASMVDAQATLRKNLHQTFAAAAAPPATRNTLTIASPAEKEGLSRFTFAPAAAEGGKIAMYSKEFYATCILGGVFACGPTHMAVTPLDVVKVNMQANKAKYTSIPVGFRLVVQEQGFSGLAKAWFPTLIGYSMQGAFKYGGYEYFKKYYADLLGPEITEKYRDLIYVAGSASAEFFADIALCPFEAVKVRLQVNPGFARGLLDGMPKIIAAEGFGGLYKGIGPLWARQIPYTIMKFWTFERSVQALYEHVVPVPKEELSKGGQLGVSFLGGYIAGVFSTLVSQPADNLVSIMNSEKGMTAMGAINKIGLGQLFVRGLTLRIIQVGTLTGAQWAIYDTIKVMAGFPTTGHVAHKEPEVTPVDTEQA